MQFTELHNHLYGSINSEDLLEIGKKNPNPRWNIYTEFHKKLYGLDVDTVNFYENYKNPKDLDKIFLFNYKAPFLEFQDKFNLIIALGKFDFEEMKYISKKVFLRQVKEKISYAEYRITLNPFSKEEDYYTKILACAEGLNEAEKEINFVSKARLIISFHRTGNFFEQYKWSKKAMKKNDLINKYLVGIDFSNIEENDPPKNKKDLFSEILKDNQSNKSSALSILYHVGESYIDKTPISACRWILESSQIGVMRIGHGIALGKDHSYLEGKFLKEKVSERLDQLNFELINFDELKSFYFQKEISEIKKEILEIGNLHKDFELSIFQDEEFLKNTISFQDFSMKKISKSNSIIEVCPTSNLRIAELDDLKTHPIKKFIEKNLKITISTDDPGIFNTNIETEYRILNEAGIKKEDLENIRKNSFLFTSEILSQREISR